MSDGPITRRVRMVRHALMYQRRRNDASTLLGLQSPKAFAVIAWFVGAGMIAAGTGAGGVHDWPLFALVMLMLMAAVVVLILAPGDPLNPIATIIVASTAPAANVLATLCCDPPPALSSAVVIGSVSALVAFLCVRGRVLSAWTAFIFSVLAALLCGLRVGEPLLWITPQIGSVAVVLMATLFAAIIRPAARTIYALRAQTEREQAAAAAVAATVAERRRQRVRLDEQARSLLGAIASGRALSEEQRSHCRLVEARLRDGIRAPALDTPGVVEAVWAARSRGVKVTLLDDSGVDDSGATDEQPSDLGRAPGIARMCTQVSEILATAPADAAVTVRVLPLGRDALGSALIRTATDQRRTEFAMDGTISGPAAIT